MTAERTKDSEVEDSGTGDELTGEAGELAFADAMGELEEILRGIEEEEIDIDHLAGELKRATELLEVCRSKIRKAEVEVQQIVDQLD